ncbi:MAG TPA: hypothetical protein VGZ00_05095 [Candidatus Baltobacteraceae bacterium]|jgi:hypothetical protein|nr:hypothetical protein [Candidatus Baltobacteraceae bacterium]
MSNASDVSSSASGPPEALIRALGNVAPAYVGAPLPVQGFALGSISFNGLDPASEVLRQRGVRAVASNDREIPVGSEIQLDRLPRGPFVSRKAVFVDKTMFIDTGYASGDHVLFGPGPLWRGRDDKLHIDMRGGDSRPRAYLVRRAEDRGWSREVALPISVQHDDSARLYAFLERQWTATNRSATYGNGGSDYIIDASRACRSSSGEWIKSYNTCVVGSLIGDGGVPTANAFQGFLRSLATTEADTWSLTDSINQAQWNAIIQESQSNAFRGNTGSWLNPRNPF